MDDELVDDELRELHDEIVWCLVRYGGLREAEAQRRVADDKLLHPEDNMDRMLLFHEEAYYWAMTMLYGKTHGYWWSTIPGSWPPPQDYYDQIGMEKYFRRRGIVMKGADGHSEPVGSDE